MNSLHRFIKQTKAIGASGNSVDFEIETDKAFLRVAGISVLTDDVDGLTGSTFDKPLRIADVDVFRDGFPVDALYVGKETAAKDRFWLFDDFLEANGKKVETTYKDGGNAGGYPYNVTLLVWVTNEKLEEPEKQ